ncbi:plasmid partitioning protein RepB [Palleronia sp. LCG004]|uniref:plasmid partitioning protein RepB n=1 Tax=Palleronia sp. LCG004 TaxID=3079304 RepID=UPI002942C72B|nr:plasmid partitioning protein RepB [Palleronia sp. LCG004]WOI58220.1 plasmid partitioning protein RepB [Palleronia sp. LCG004]
MARKDLMKGLMGEDEDSPSPAPKPDPQSPGPDAPRKRAGPRYSKGAIGAVSQSIADLKTRSIVDLDPFTIEAGGLQDRLEHDDADHALLMDSLKTYGQQVPILVRHHPETADRYQIVYGRRRVLALRDLGQPVKAMIRDLDDREAIMAQGQENSARRDLSFIERVNFARQMIEAGYDRKIIGDALSTDKTLISRMISISESLPVELIETIGAAPGIGRDRWLDFSRRWTEAEYDIEDAETMLSSCPSDGSDARFDYLHEWLTRKDRTVPRQAPVPRPPREPLKRPDGVAYGHLTRGPKSTRIEISAARGRGFDTWLAENLDRIHRDWLNGRGEEGP